MKCDECNTGELVGYWRTCGEAVLPKKHSFISLEGGHNCDLWVHHIGCILCDQNI